MGARPVPPPGAAVLFVSFAVLLAVVSFGAAEAAPAVVVGSVKCLDCSPNDVNAEDAFKGLQVAIKCRSGVGETYETQTLGLLDDTGAFSIPLQAGLLREDGALDRDCFAQLHSAPGTPCAGLAPPKIGPSSQGGAAEGTYLSVADGTVFSPVACMCKKKKKHFMMGPPPPPPQPRPQPSYGPPTPTPTPPTPSYGPPMPNPPEPPAEEEPEPFFHKHPKMKMHKKKPCPPEDKAEPKN
ncbi:unnamed protein product [Alopecurus aequalis]